MKKTLESWLLILALTLTFLSSVVRVQAATTVTETFTSRLHFDSDGGMVWNSALGELHPPLMITGWDDGVAGVDGPTLYSVGDGRHGSFVASRYSIFDTDGVVSGGVIEVDTDTYPDLQFTDFNLEVGYTIRPIGSAPLVIRSLTNVVVDGVIDCSGEDGLDAVASTTSLIAGGVGRCGGGSGGASVLPGVAPGVSNQGTSGGTGVTGGAGGPIRLATGGQGGGGGGAFIKAFAVMTDHPDPQAGDNSIGGAGGAAGLLNRDDGFVIDINGAGSGGGGGSAFDDPGDVPNHSSGAGGGAGGGNIRIYVVGNIVVKSNIGAVGEIHADGGDGGSVAGGLKGGAGGGGGAGSILMFAGGDITLGASVTAQAGSGGTTAGGAGGDGAWGRTWLVEKDGFASGAFIESPDSQLNVPGNARYETGVTYTVTSTAIDLGNTKPTVTSLPMTVANLGASTLVYDLAFNDTSDLSALNSFFLNSTYLSAEVQRYVRFRIQVDNTNATTPVRIQDLTFAYEGFVKKEFSFVTGCGKAKDVSSASLGGFGTGPFFLLFFLLPLLFVRWLRRE